MRSPWLLFLLLVCSQLGCGGGQTRGRPLDSSWDDENGDELESFVASFRVARPPPSLEAAIGVVDRETIVGRALPDGDRWVFEHELEGRPVLTGRVVVGVGGGELFALDAKSGELLWTRRALGRLRGASDDGATTLVSMASLSMRRSIVLAVGRNGHVRRQIYENAMIGAPTVLDDFAFLPYERDRVLIFDLLAGSEAARIISKVPVTRAFMVDSELFVGERGALRFDSDVVKARHGGGTYLELPRRELPGDPKWMIPGNTALPMAATRRDSVRYYARPRTTKSGTRIDRYALSFFQLVVGLSAPDGRTRWAHVSNATFLGGAAGDQTLVLCDAAGDIRWLDLETGAVIKRRSLEESVLSCAVQTNTPRPGDVPANPATVAEQLTEAISATGMALVPTQLVLLEDLAALPTEEATEALIRLARRDENDGSDREPIRLRAAELLSERRVGLAAITRELYRGRIDIPLVPMTRALLGAANADQGYLGAGRALAWRLQDPRWPAADVTAMATALERLATRDERNLLAFFFSRVRCTDPTLHDAVIAVARTLVRFDRASLVKKVMSEACDHDAMRERLGAVLPPAR